MSGQHMDVAVEAALAAGRAVIVPTPQRAAALRFAWARRQIAQGLAVWNSPQILTWDAWIVREWQRASRQSPAGAARICLTRSQERQLWEQVLGDLDTGPELLTLHASALARSAARAAQSLIPLSRMGVTEEEQLLVAAWRRLDDLCRKQGWISLALSQPGEFAQLESEAPLIAGEQKLLPVQQRLGNLLWPDVALLAAPPAPGVEPRHVQAPDAGTEIKAIARWCRAQLSEDGSRRLLVISARTQPPLRVLASQIWHEFAAGSPAARGDAIDPALLTIEGGESLLQHALIGDALSALQMLRAPIDSAVLSRMLLSPYLNFGVAADCVRLELQLRDWRRARWHPLLLVESVGQINPPTAASQKVAAWLQRLNDIASDASFRTGADWAMLFDEMLGLAGFPGDRALDSRDAQRLNRWRELLDEFASLDAVSAPLSADEAMHRLHALATRSTHQAASTDAAITCTDDLGDPLVHYDGIWVLGLSERYWPEPPRPDPYVPLGEQQRAAWPEANVTLRAQQARYQLQCWRARTPNLVLSYAALDDDIHFRPSPLLSSGQPVWEILSAEAGPAPLRASETSPDDDVLPAIALTDKAVKLRAGSRLLQLQQDCPFRSQAELRLGAQALEEFSDGIDARLRGRLLHSVCECLWREVQDQPTLLSMNDTERSACIDRCWEAALREIDDRAAPIDARSLERERARTRRLMSRLLELESQRAPFRVAALEQELPIQWSGAGLIMRVDRIDELTDGSKLLIDYKGGRAGSIRLEQDEPRPIQLAAYAAALAARGTPVQGVALLSLHPAQMRFSGRAADTDAAPSGLKPMPAWNNEVLRWCGVVEALLRAHLAGDARVAPAAGACRGCHLPSFCRIRPGGERLDEEADTEGGAQ